MYLMSALRFMNFACLLLDLKIMWKLCISQAQSCYLIVMCCFFRNAVYSKPFQVAILKLKGEKLLHFSKSKGCHFREVVSYCLSAIPTPAYCSKNW